MIKAYGNGCQNCKQLEFWSKKTTIDIKYKSVDNSIIEDLLKTHNTMSIPIILNDGVLMGFDECLSLLQQNRRK